MIICGNEELSAVDICMIWEGDGLRISLPAFYILSCWRIFNDEILLIIDTPIESGGSTSMVVSSGFFVNGESMVPI